MTNEEILALAGEPFGYIESGRYSINTDGGPNAWRKRKAYKGALYTSDQLLAVAKPMEDEIAELKQQLESYRADAERYRFLREQRWSESNMCVVLYPKNAVRLGHECPSGERLDCYIDAAKGGE